MTKEEFKNLLAPSKGKMFRVALSLLGNRQEAEDALQDIYLKLWNMRGQILEYNSAEALAITMIKNRCIDKLRSYRHRNLNDEEVGMMTIYSTTPDPGKAAELNDSLQNIHNIVQSLPDQQRLIIHLRDVEQYNYEEISEITGLTINNIRVHLSRARKKVRTEYLKRQNYGNRKN